MEESRVRALAKVVEVVFDGGFMYFCDKYLKDFIDESDYEKILPKIFESQKKVNEKNGKGSEMLGWLDCVENFDNKIFEIAEKIRTESKVVVVLGIGGSFLGAKMMLEFLKIRNGPKIVFRGNGVDPEPILDAIELFKDSEISLIVVSKSGNTLETMVTFNFFYDYMVKKYGCCAHKRITAITGNFGSLRKISDDLNFDTLTIPENIGGRFSCLTAAGLLPLAIVGTDVIKILSGFASAKEELSKPELNPCLKYAAVRHVLYGRGMSVEVMSSFFERLRAVLEWWRQLFGESEGKNGKGIFPATAFFSKDLHSIGQFIQEGSRILFETILEAEEDPVNMEIKNSTINDNVSFLKGKTFGFVNRKILEGVASAHSSGGAPCSVIGFKDFSEESLGELVFFFEYTCAISAYMLGINPFDQPGVETYKKNANILLRN